VINTKELVIEGRPKVHLLRSLRELWQYRGTIMAFAERTIRVNYKQAALGIVWVVMVPLTNVVLYIFVFERIMGIHVHNYGAFVLGTQVPWQYMSSVTSGCSNAAIGNSGLMRKVYFPREVPGVSTIFSSGVNFVIVFLLYIALAPLLGAHLTWYLIFVPFLIIPVAVLGAGAGLGLGAFNIYYRDFSYLLGFVTQLWFWVTPIIYPLTKVPDHLRTLYIAVNPAVGLFNSFSRVLTYGQMPDMPLLAFSIGQTLVVATIGFAIFKRLEPLFADVA
jgi:homopolymeric O-antigen transport system permease protein